METGTILNAAQTQASIQNSVLGATIPTTIKFEELKTVAKLEARAGNRLCRIINKGAGNVSVGAIVPAMPDNEIDELITVPAVRTAIREMLEGVQDKIVRKLLTENTTSKEIPNDIFAGITASTLITDYLQAENESKIRLSKEAIEQWFIADIAPLLVAALKAKGITQEKQLIDTCMAFKNSFAVLAGKQVSMSEQIKGQLEKALLLLPEGYENHVAELVASKLLTVQEARVEIAAL